MAPGQLPWGLSFSRVYINCQTIPSIFRHNPLSSRISSLKLHLFSRLYLTCRRNWLVFLFPGRLFRYTRTVSKLRHETERRDVVLEQIVAHVQLTVKRLMKGGRGEHQTHCVSLPPSQEDLLRRIEIPDCGRVEAVVGSPTFAAAQLRWAGSSR